MNIFKRRVLHIIVGALALLSIILIVGLPVKFWYREWHYSYYLGSYYTNEYAYYLLSETSEGLVALILLASILTIAVLYQFKFMHKIPFVGRKLIGGLIYIIGGSLSGLCIMGHALDTGRSVGPIIPLIVMSVAILVFGILFIATRRPKVAQSENVADMGLVYQSAPQNPIGQTIPAAQSAPFVPQQQVDGLYYELKGAQKILRVYDDRVTLEILKNARAVITNNWFGGTKEIYYSDMLSIQFKESSNLILGYIQFETASTHAGDNFGSENSWTFDYRTIPNEKAKEVENFVRTKMRESKKPQFIQQNNQPSVAEELLNWKKLLDGGVITQEEFEAKKNELLKK